MYFNSETFKFADLHTHTTCSDGCFSPTELVAYAAGQNVGVMAITDHDSVAGIDEAIRAGFKYGVEIIPGIELNTDIKDADLHVLGYYIDYNDPGFVTKLDALRNSRVERMRMMIDKLAKAGFRMSLEEVYEEADRTAGVADDSSIGRPHLARLMVRKGFAEDEKAVFDRYIGNGKPCHVEVLNKLSPSDAVKFIVKYGGVAVMAHPGLTQRDDIIPQLVSCGLAGLEAVHSAHDPSAVARYERMAEKLGLLVTGGSDCHGPRGNCQPLCGNVKLPLSRVEALKRKKGLVA